MTLNFSFLLLVHVQTIPEDDSYKRKAQEVLTVGASRQIQGLGVPTIRRPMQVVSDRWCVCMTFTLRVCQVI